MYKAGKAAQVAAEVNNYRISLLGLCETRWTQSGQMGLSSEGTILAKAVWKRTLPSPSHTHTDGGSRPDAHNGSITSTHQLGGNQLENHHRQVEDKDDEH